MKKTPIDVLVLAVSDYANSGANYARSLRKLGLNVITAKGDFHQFMYPEQMMVHPDLLKGFVLDRTVIQVDSASLRDMIDNSRVIVFKGSHLIDCGYDLTKKTVIVHHGGSVYRENAGIFNDLWNPIAAHTVIQCPDLLGLGAKNEVLIIYPVDTEFLKPISLYGREHAHVIFGHFPSNAATKGSAAINQVASALDKVEEIKGRWEYVTSASNGIWFNHIDHKRQCDVYIEGLQPDIAGKQYGAWGNSAIEAAALGKVVITHSRFDDLYRKEYGEHPFLIANTKDELFQQMIRIACWSSETLRDMQKRTREWVVKTHSFTATALRMWDKVYRPYFPEKDIKNALQAHRSDRETICQTLRDIYDIVDHADMNGFKPVVKDKLESAMSMAKKMNDRLYDYKADWDKDLFPEKEANA